MKVLIFSMTCGQGHNMIAKSLEESFKDYNAEVKISQFYQSEKMIKKGNRDYLFACKYIPHIYQFVWNKLRNKNHYNGKLPTFAKKSFNYFIKEIQSYNPDIIVCTHLYASAIISYMKINNMLNKNIITATILFDFCLAPYWEYSKNVDYIFQPFENTTNALIEKGFDKNQIVTLGMPVRKVFKEPYNSDELKNQLLGNTKTTILIQGGGGGIGKNDKLVFNLHKNIKDINIICANGSNKKTYNKIEKYIKKYNTNNIYNLSFTDKLPLYMKASDIIVTKGGGNGISEILAIKKPFIIREKTIINEKINKKMLIKDGIALGINKPSELANVVKQLLQSPNLLSKLKFNIDNLSRPNASDDIAKFLINKINENNKNN